MSIWARFWKRRRVDPVFENLENAMRGQSKISASLLWVIHGIRGCVPQPGRLWRVRLSALESLDNNDAIVSARMAVIGGMAPLDTSTFDLLKDTWECYLGCELDVDQGRVVCVEVLDPCAFDDCGQLLKVAVVEGMHELPMTHGREWVIDIESASVLAQTG